MVQVSIYEKIEKKGALDAQKIKEAGEEKARLQMQEAVADANRDIEVLIQKTVNANNEIIKTKITEFEQAAKKSTLSIKKSIIDEVFNTALKQLQKLDGEPLSKFVINLLKKDQLSGDEVILVAKEDLEKYAKVFSSGKKTNNEYDLDVLNKQLGKNFAIKLRAIDENLNGGFIVEGKTYDINHSFPAILNQVITANEAEIAKALFSKEQ